MVRHRLRFFALLVGLAALTLALAPVAADDTKEEKWTPLFNGKDLTGWKVYPKGQGKWRVEDGVLIGSGPASHLFSEGGDYENFRFRVEVAIGDKSNSGQYFRTKFGPGFPDGYEAQINSTHGDRIKTGSLYPARLKLNKGDDKKLIVTDILVKPNEWFTQEVIARGKHIVIKVNDKTTVDFVDEHNNFTKGHFALQQHDPGSTVKFRKIEVIELPADKKE